MHLRKIKLEVLFGQGFTYRSFIICCNALFFLIFFNDIGMALKLFVMWNVINICLYFVFHYMWAKMFKIGKTDKEGGLEWHVSQHQRCKPLWRIQ